MWEANGGFISYWATASFTSIGQITMRNTSQDVCTHCASSCYPKHTHLWDFSEGWSHTHTHVQTHSPNEEKHMRRIICKHTDTVLLKNAHLWPRAEWIVTHLQYYTLHKANRGITQTQQQTEGQWVTYNGNTDTASSLFSALLLTEMKLVSSSNVVEFRKWVSNWIGIFHHWIDEFKPDWLAGTDFC